MDTAGAPLIHVGHCAWTWRVLLVQVGQIEAGLPDKVIHLAVQMTAARHATPGRSEPVLPAFDAWLGRSPCSTKQRLPFGLSTLRISRKAASGSGIEQRVQVITTVSTASSASGIAVAEPRRSSTGIADAAARRRAIDSKRSEGSIP